jgi:hypothetical protein
MATMKNEQQSVWAQSLYIPRIDFEITKSQVRDYFENELHIGMVGRIDYVSINTEHGTGRRVFVHFTSLYEDEHVKANNMFDEIALKGFSETMIKGVSIRVMINRKPVPPSHLNMDQIASNTEFLAEDMKVQQEKVEKLEKMVETLYQKLEEQYMTNQQLQQQCIVLQQQNAQNTVALQQYHQLHLQQQSYGFVPPPPFSVAPGYIGRAYDREMDPDHDPYAEMSDDENRAKRLYGDIYDDGFNRKAGDPTPPSPKEATEMLTKYHGTPERINDFWQEVIHGTPDEVAKEADKVPEPWEEWRNREG